MLTDKFSPTEYDSLIEAVGALESREASNYVSTMLIGAMFTPKEDQDRFVAEEKRRAKEMEANSRPIKERCAILKAKLILMRDALVAEEMTTVHADT